MGQEYKHGSSCSIKASAFFEQESTDVKVITMTTTKAFKNWLTSAKCIWPNRLTAERESYFMFFLSPSCSTVAGRNAVKWRNSAE